MPSNSLARWEIERQASLDELEHAHRQVGGAGPGRRHATQQVNQAYAVLLSSQFQAYCRDLHSESVDYFVASIAAANQDLATILQAEFVFGRKLDKGNPTPANLGSDFNRLGMNIWHKLAAMDTRNASRRRLLEELNAWRNAIAHQSFDAQELGGQTSLRLAQVRTWRRACAELAQQFDVALGEHLQTILGRHPWP